jgi:hypothetical protein
MIEQLMGGRMYPLTLDGRDGAMREWVGLRKPSFTRPDDASLEMAAEQAS